MNEQERMAATGAFDEIEMIEPTGKFVALGRRLYGPDGMWLGTPRSKRAAAKAARILNDLVYIDDVAYSIISHRPERAYWGLAHGRKGADPDR